MAVVAHHLLDDKLAGSQRKDHLLVDPTNVRVPRHSRKISAMHDNTVAKDDLQLSCFVYSRFFLQILLWLVEVGNDDKTDGRP